MTEVGFTMAFESARYDFGDCVLAEVQHVLEGVPKEERYSRFFRSTAPVAGEGRKGRVGGGGEG